MMCIQESKLGVVDDWMIKSIWSDVACGYSYQPSVGASGGLVTVWDTSYVNVWFTMSFRHVLVIKGTVVSTAENFTVVNVYAPCDSEAKRALWDALSPLVANNIDDCVCVCGDFNYVLNGEERRGQSTMFRQADSDLFNKFIEENCLMDLPICSRLFTWYHGDGVSMSRLDRFLLSTKWCEAWPNSIQVAHQMGLSDHVPLSLHVDEANWGPRPLRMLKCWADFPGFDDFVRTKWGSLNLQG